MNPFSFENIKLSVLVRFDACKTETNSNEMLGLFQMQGQVKIPANRNYRIFFMQGRSISIVYKNTALQLAFSMRQGEYEPFLQ